MDFDAFIEQAWADHGDAPEAVAQRLEALRVTDPAHVAPLARLAVHVYAVHLGATERGVALMRALPADPAVARGIGTLRLVAGAPDAIDALGTEDRIFALSVASTVWADRGERADAIAAVQRAQALAEAGLPDGSPAIRALASGGNNLSAALEDLPERTDAENAAMVKGAEIALAHWKRAGGWLEHERAEYRLASSLYHAGRGAEAGPVARRCLAICEANAAPAFERFFAHALLALIARASGDAHGFDTGRRAAQTLFELVPEDERRWCEPELAKLRATA